MLINNVGSLEKLLSVFVQKLTAAMGKSPHSGGLPFSLKRNRPAILLPARAAGIYTGFPAICNPPNEIF